MNIIKILDNPSIAKTIDYHKKVLVPVAVLYEDKVYIYYDYDGGFGSIIAAKTGVPEMEIGSIWPPFIYHPDAKLIKISDTWQNNNPNLPIDAKTDLLLKNTELYSEVKGNPFAMPIDKWNKTFSFMFSED